MTHGQVAHHGDAEIACALSEHLLEAETICFGRVFIAVCELPQADAGQLLQPTAQPPVGEHALDSVWRFAYVFEHQNGAAQIRQIRRTQQVGGHGEVGGQQGACGAAATPALALKVAHGFAKQQAPQPLLAPGGFGGQGGEQRPVDGTSLPLG